MTESDPLPIVNETAPETCSTSCRCGHSTLARAIIYTPVVLVISGLAAMAMFPSLADHVMPASSGFSNANSSGGNPNCPIQMLMSAFSSGPSQGSPCCRSQTATAMNPQAAAQMMRMMDCCPSSRCGISTSPDSCPNEGAETTDAASDEPMDALAAIQASQTQPAAEESATN